MISFIPLPPFFSYFRPWQGEECPFLPAPKVSGQKCPQTAEERGLLTAYPPCLASLGLRGKTGHEHFLDTDVEMHEPLFVRAPSTKGLRLGQRPGQPEEAGGCWPGTHWQLWREDPSALEVAVGRASGREVPREVSQPGEWMTSGCSPGTQAQGPPWQEARPFAHRLAWVTHVPRHLH